MHAYIDQKMFTVAFLRIAKNRNISDIYQSTMNKLWYVHKVEYCITMKMNELLQVTSWINLSVKGR